MQIFDSEERNETRKKIILLFFILFYIACLFALYKYSAEPNKNFLAFIIGSIILIGIYLYYIFQPPFITKIILLWLPLLFIPILLYLQLQEINQKENEFVENIITKIIPQFLKYQYYILFGIYAIFEVVLRLLSKYSQALKTKIQKNPFTIRIYFFIVLVVANFLIEMFL